MNRVTLLGNLTRNVELKTLQSGNVVGNVGIATNESYIDKQGNKVDKVAFHNLTLWGKRAETLAQYTQKGSKVLVEGKIEYQEYEKDGVKRIITKIIVDRFEFAGSKPAGQQANNVPVNNNPVSNAPVSNTPVNNAPVNSAPVNQPGGEDEIRIEDIPF